MKTKRLTFLISLIMLFYFLLTLPSAIFSESRTGYDGAGNYIPDIVTDEKESRKLPKPTPRGVPSLKELDKLMTGVDLWEMDKPLAVEAWCRRVSRPWLISKEA